MTITLLPILVPVAGLLLFAAILGCGRLLIRRLQLIDDPPPTALFEPKPPKAIPLAESAGAAARAEERRERWEICKLAERAYQAQTAIEEWRDRLVGLPDEAFTATACASAEAARKAQTEAQAHARTATKRACDHMHHSDRALARAVCQEAADEVAAQSQTLDQALAALPTADNRKLWILLGCLLVAMIWLGLMQVFLP